MAKYNLKALKVMAEIVLRARELSGYGNVNAGFQYIQFMDKMTYQTGLSESAVLAKLRVYAGANI
jgi:hypothetical protein